MVDPRVCPSKGKIELADVVRRFGPQYAAEHGERMMPSHKKALADIAACCTKELGGRLYGCDDCDDTFWSYHCCRNRACPKCHAGRTQEWLQKRQAELLPCDYFHAVVTVPPGLRGVPSQPEVDVWPADAGFGRGDQGPLCRQTASRGSPRHTVGAPHLEWPPGLSPPCALALNRRRNHGRWPALGAGAGRVSRASRCPFPQDRRAVSRGPGGQAPAVFAEISADVWRREWVSFCKHYGHGNDAVLTYLSRYVFRTAICNARILDMDQTHVTFRWKDRGAGAWCTERLSGVEFLRRFLQHVLPRGFHKVRYYGLWNPCQREQSNRAWVLLILTTPVDSVRPPKLAAFSDPLSELTESSDQRLDQVSDHSESVPRCPYCGGCRTRFIGEYGRSGVP